MCSKAGIYLFLGNVANECDQEHGHSIGDSDLRRNINSLCTTDGVEISSFVRMSGCHLIPADPYSNRSAAEVEEDLEEKRPNRLAHNHPVSWMQRFPQALCSGIRVSSEY